MNIEIVRIEKEKSSECIQNRGNTDTVMFYRFFQYKEMWNDGFWWLDGNYQEMMFVLATFITFSLLSSIMRYLHMQIFTNISPHHGTHMSIHISTYMCTYKLPEVNVCSLSNHEIACCL